MAIRRLREALALARADYQDEEVTGVEDRLTTLFKALGRARDADAAQHLIQHVEARLPLAPAMVGQLREEFARRQLKTRRRMVKTLEAVDIDALPSQLLQARRARSRFSSGSSWRESLRLHLHDRAAGMQHAIERAGGVYFRKRSHDARLAIKQFRYALEMAEATGSRMGPSSLRVLRKAQDALGQAHDREVLIARLRLPAKEGLATYAAEADTIKHFLNGEISAFHQRYLELRPALREASVASLHSRRGLPLRAGAMAVAALALPVVVARRRA